MSSHFTANNCQNPVTQLLYIFLESVEAANYVEGCVKKVGLLKQIQTQQSTSHIHFLCMENSCMYFVADIL
jgi:hypothetical protein